MEKAEKKWTLKCNWMEMKATPSFLGREALEKKTLTADHAKHIKIQMLWYTN